MIGNKKVLVNILARAGSTSVKDKNIAVRKNLNQYIKELSKF